MVDCNTLIGPYPYRYVPHPDPDVLVRVLEREGMSGAWVGHLPSAFYRDPTPGNAVLFTALAPFAETLQPVPFEDLRQRHSLDTAGDLSAAAVRATVRASADVRIVVTAAGREMIEEVH